MYKARSIPKLQRSQLALSQLKAENERLKPLADAVTAAALTRDVPTIMAAQNALRAAMTPPLPPITSEAHVAAWLATNHPVGR